jgi:hypothetical protein
VLLNYFPEVCLYPGERSCIFKPIKQGNNLVSIINVLVKLGKFLAPGFESFSEVLKLAGEGMSNIAIIGTGVPV